MTVKANNRLNSFARIAFFGGVLVVAVGLVYLFLSPKLYQASVKIRMANWIGAHSTNDMHPDFDIAAECQVVSSEAVLDQVITNLGLKELWGKRLGQGVPLKPEQSRLLLKSKTNVHPIPKSSLVQIDVISEDREETAKIANEVARVYHDQRQAKRQALNDGRLAIFRQKWEQVDKEVQQAQAALDKFYLDLMKDRTTNPATMYDVIQSQRVKLEGQYIEQRDQLTRLKTMNPEQLKQVLSTLETNPNSLLNASLTKRSKARTDLIYAQSTYAADSPEMKHATLAVDELDKVIARTMEGIMTAREKEVASLKEALDQLTEKLKRASTNLNEIAAQNTTYNQAGQNLTNLMMERDALQQKMNQEDSQDAMSPDVIVAEIIESADPPQKPVSPDGRIAASTIGIGSLAAVAGLFLLLAGQTAKPEPGSGGRPRLP